MKGNFIYALIDPRTDEIRYIGKCSGYLNSRFRGHLYEARSTSKHTHKLAWIRNLLADSMEPVVKVLEEVLYKEDLAVAECRWIENSLEQGVRLTNGTTGGEGMPNPSPATREKLRNRPQVGFPTSAREACSKRLKELWADPEYRAMMEAKAAARWESPEYRNKMEAVLIERNKSQEQREKVSASRKRSAQN